MMFHPHRRCRRVTFNDEDKSILMYGIIFAHRIRLVQEAGRAAQVIEAGRMVLSSTAVARSESACFQRCNDKIAKPCCEGARKHVTNDLDNRNSLATVCGTEPD
jgi:hypothetical protein